jgi:hypothetical protein
MLVINITTDHTNKTNIRDTKNDTNYTDKIKIKDNKNNANYLNFDYSSLSVIYAVGVVCVASGAYILSVWSVWSVVNSSSLSTKKELS